MKGKKWTKDDLLILNYWVQYERLDQVAERLGRTECSVRDKCRRLGIRLKEVKRVKVANKPSSYVPDNAWSEEETALVREGIKTKTIKELSEELGRSVASVSHRLRVEGILVREVRAYIRKKKRPSDRLWSKKDIKFLKNNAEVLTSEQIGEALGKHPKTIRGYASRKGISLKKGGWGAEELDILEKYIKEGASWESMAEVFGRGVEAVRAKARYLDLDYTTSRWSEADVEALLRLRAEGKTYAEVAKRLGRTLKSVRKKASRLASSS